MLNNSEISSYEDFEKLHVVRTLRQILANWWNVQINFTDRNGFLRGVPQGKFFNPANPVCAGITKNHTGFKHCMGQVRRSSEFLGIKKPQIGMCHSGFSTIILPIQVDGKDFGCLFADGFIIGETSEVQKEKIRTYLKDYSSPDFVGLEQYIDSLPILTNKDVTYLTELLELVISEAISVQKTLSESDIKLDLIMQDLVEKWDFGKMVGKSKAMIDLFKLLTRVCSSDATILITGENGSGKEGIARAVHFNSKRKNQNFVVQNCGAINDNLLESELFGHVKGSFTSAIRDKKGLFELADHGTLFLDEIGDTSPSMQVKLLRVLQEGTFIPVGGSEQRKVDVRLLAATNKNLEAMVKDGSFREDLYYRLNVINIKVPALRERKEDIPILIKSFIEEYAKSNKQTTKKIPFDCMARLEEYDWPGNVRELQNEVERLCVLAGDSDEINSSYLSDRIRSKKEEKYPGLRVDGKLKDILEEIEKRLILESLMRENWNKSKVARILGISRAGLIMKCEKFGYDRDERFKVEKEELANLNKKIPRAS